jgi:hypothetical protein
MPEEVRNVCALAEITSKSTLLQIVRQGDPSKMLALVERLAGQGTVTRQQARSETSKQKPVRARSYTFAFKPPTKAFNLKLTFRKSRVDADEVIETLEGILKDLRAARRR